MKKSVISAALAVIMMLSALLSGCGAFSPDVSWSYNDGELVFSGNGDINYSVGGWRSIDTEIRKITIEEGITGIGEYCFENLADLEEVTIPESVKFIGEGAFRNCIKLDNVSVPAGVGNIGNAAFNGCVSLESMAFAGDEEDVKLGEGAVPSGVDILYNIPVSPSEPDSYETTGYVEAETTRPYEGTSRPTQPVTESPTREAYPSEESPSESAPTEESPSENYPAEESPSEEYSTEAPTMVDTTAAPYEPDTEVSHDTVAPEAIYVDRISVSTMPSKRTYYEGDTLNTSGMKVRVYYSDNSSKIIEGGFTCSPTKLSTVGTQTITVSYGGCTTQFSVTVKAVEVSAISVYSNPTKLTYNKNDYLDTAGMVVKVYYTNGSTQTVKSGFTCSPTKLTTAGSQKITVTYGSKTTSFYVTVNEVKLSSISIASKPSKVTYEKGEKLNTSGLKLTAKYTDGSVKTVTSGFTCSPTTLNYAGNQTITVTYGSKTTSFTVKVNDIYIKSISVSSQPSKNIYNVGDTLNTSGLKLSVKYSDGSTKTVTSGFTCSPTVFNYSGTQTVNVSYGGFTTSFKVVVNNVSPNAIKIKSLPTKTSYIVGEKLNTSGLVVELVYSNGKTERLNSGYTLSPTVFSKTGTQSVTVSYNGLSTKFNVTVYASSGGNYYDFTTTPSGSSSTSSNGDPMIKRGTPTIDGKLDSKYKKSLCLPALGTEPNAYGTDWWFTCSADVYFLYDNSYLYICAVVQDDDVLTKGEAYATGDNPYANDSIEFRLSLDGTVDTIKVGVDAYGYACYGLASHYARLDYSSIKYKTTKTDTSYTVEVAIPCTRGALNMIEAGKLGFCYQLNDINADGKHVNHTTSFNGEAVKMPVFYYLSDEYA